jgi:putative FmdB family regulatory protein
LTLGFERRGSGSYDPIMPIYEYLCEACGMVNEKLQKVNDPPPARCDECGSRKLAKLVSRSAFQLKGGGWYSDLYASKKKEAPAKEGAEAAAPPKTESKGDAKPETKPDAKADAATPAPAAPAAPKPAAADGPAKKGRKTAG